MNPKTLFKKIALIVYNIFLKFPIKNKVILFESNVGRNYSSNPKYIYEEILSRNTDFKCVWSLEDTSLEIPGNPTKIRKNGLKYLYYMATSKFWIFDTREPSFIPKRPETTYIQTWHGTPLKKLAMDLDFLVISDGMSLEEYKSHFKENTEKWDYLLSQSSYTTEKFKSAFVFDSNFLEIGSPRNDTLFKNNNETYINSIKEKFKLPKDKKIILYAPTWRDNDFKSNGIYNFSSEIDLDLMKNELDNDYILIIKKHYLVDDKIDTTLFGDFLYITNDLWDIQDLYLISDILLTDYSSVMFDYSILKRPMLIYAYDYEEYKDSIRGFYFNIYNEFPGPICKETNKIIENIKKNNFQSYETDYDLFLNKYTDFEKGNASIKLVDFILNSIKL